MKVTIYQLESGTRFIKVIGLGSKVVLEMWTGSPEKPAQAVLFNRRAVSCELVNGYVRAWQLKEYVNA